MVNHQNGSLVFNLFKFEDNCFVGQLQRNNFFSIIWVKEGSGKVKTGFSEFDFQDNSLFTFAPSQPYLFSTENPIKGIVINFHAEFIFSNSRTKHFNLINRDIKPVIVKDSEKEGWQSQIFDIGSGSNHI